jgi:hypothetical protein
VCTFSTLKYFVVCCDSLLPCLGEAHGRRDEVHLELLLSQLVQIEEQRSHAGKESRKFDDTASQTCHLANSNLYLSMDSPRVASD